MNEDVLGRGQYLISDVAGVGKHSSCPNRLSCKWRNRPERNGDARGSGEAGPATLASSLGPPPLGSSSVTASVCLTTSPFFSFSGTKKPSPKAAKEP